MTLQIVNTTRQTRVNDISSAIGASGLLKVWAGSKPANPSTADLAGSNLLASFTLGATAFASAAGADGSAVTAALNGTPLTATAGNSGTATFFRIYTSGGTCIAQGDVSTDITVTPTAIVSGATVTLSGYTLSEAA